VITAGWLLLFSQSLWDNFSTSRKTIHEICLGIIPSFGVNKSHPWRESVLTWQAGTSTIYGWYSWDNHGISNHLPSGVSHLACHHLVRWTFSQLIIYIYNWLVVEPPTPLKNDGRRQLRWLCHSQYMEKMFQTTNQYNIINIFYPYC